MISLVDIQDLSVTLGNTPLLRNINVSVEQGDYLCILGANGAGKSTLIKTIMGMQPYSGEINLKQQALSQLSQKQIAQQVSYVPQANDNNLNFKVEDFIKLSRYAYHTAFSTWSKSDQQAFDNAIEITQVSPFLHRQIASLSGGERQKIMIAAAVCQQSPLLLLDEPTSFLDPHHQVEVHQLIHSLNQQHHITIIEVSHDINHAAQHSQTILALKQGQTQWLGAANDFLQTSILHDLYGQDFVFTTHPQTGARIALASELI